MKKIVIYKIIFVSIFFLFVSCGNESQKIEKTRIVYSKYENMDDTSLYKNFQSKDGRGSGYFCRVDSINQYGHGIFYTLPDSLTYRNIRLISKSWVKISDNAPEKMIGISINDAKSDSILKWTDIKPSSKNIALDKWTLVEDSITITESLNSRPDVLLKIFPYTANKIGTLDVDDLEIYIKTIDSLIVE